MSGPEGKGVFCMEFVGARRCSYVQRRSKTAALERRMYLEHWNALPEGN